MNVVEQVEPTEASEVRESPFALDFLLYYGQQKVNNECAPDLYFYRTLVITNIVFIYLYRLDAKKCL